MPDTSLTNEEHQREQSISIATLPQEKGDCINEIGTAVEVYTPEQRREAYINSEEYKSSDMFQSLLTTYQACNDTGSTYVNAHHYNRLEPYIHEPTVSCTGNTNTECRIYYDSDEEGCGA